MTEHHSKETRKLIQDVARETAKCVSHNVSKKAVHETLVSVGIDPSDPLGAQETQANMRAVAALAPSLTTIAALYEDPETREGIQFAKNVNKAYKSTRNRALVGIGAAAVTGYVTGLWNKMIG